MTVAASSANSRRLSGFRQIWDGRLPRRGRRPTMAAMPAAASSPIFDVVVAGAGPAGLAFAAAVKQALGSGIVVALVDPRPQARDGRLRTVALAEGPRRLIEQVGAWDGAGAARPADPPHGDL